MKLLTNTINYEDTISIALNMNENYDKSVVFHCYWIGELNEKHFYSILSCYYFNVRNKKHKIILWLENNIPNSYNIEIEKYAEIKTFSLNNEKKDTFLENINNLKYNNMPSFYSDIIRYLLLYKYGGIWFDLDYLFLRSLDPLFHNFSNEICCYTWENQFYPNGAIYISLEKKSDKMKKNIEFIINRNRGWGFQEANLTFDLPLDILVLPCSWFDTAWIDNSYNINFDNFFEDTNITYSFDNFYKGAFCFHWHNRWDKEIKKTSIINQLINIIKFNITIMV